MTLKAHEVIRKLERCKHCGKRIFLTRAGRYGTPQWLHYGYALSECDGIRLKYATPKEGDE